MISKKKEKTLMEHLDNDWSLIPMGCMNSTYVLSFCVPLLYTHLNYYFLLEIVLTIGLSSDFEENTFALKRYKNSLPCNICTF